jgi:hypothetical protein
MVAEAYDFVTQELGLEAMDPTYVDVVEPAREQEVKKRFDIPDNWSGFYNEEPRYALIFADDESDLPLTAQTTLGSRTVHELTHSGTKNLNAHGFYTETLAGLGELRYLDWLTNHGRHQQASDFTLHVAGVVLDVPANARYLHASEAAALPTEGPTKSGFTSQGLIAIASLEPILSLGDYTTEDLLEAASEPTAMYARMMRGALAAVRPGLTREIRSFSGRVDGVYKATHALQKAKLQSADIDDFVGVGVGGSGNFDGFADLAAK